MEASQVHGILQARLLEWVAIPLSRGSFQPRDQIWVYRQYITSVFRISSFIPFSGSSLFGADLRPLLLTQCKLPGVRQRLLPATVQYILLYLA